MTSKLGLAVSEIELSINQALELDNIASGVFHPLKTFCGENDYNCILHNMKLESGDVWPIPIVLAVDKSIYEKSKYSQGPFLLIYNKIPLAVLCDTEEYELDPNLEAEKIYGTLSIKHPGVDLLTERRRYAITGKLIHLARFKQNEYLSRQFDPDETKLMFRSNGWNKIVGFQTRNPIHRAHEYVIKSSLECVDGAFINPLAGPQKEDDIPANVRMETYDALIGKYFNPKYVALGIYPSPMYYAGPKEAVLHAIVRKNYGCTHFVVGRDHAGVGNFYGPYDAQNLVDQVGSIYLGIEIIKFDIVCYSITAKSMVSTKTRPVITDVIDISGSELRRRLQNGEEVPEEISRPEVVDILRRYYSGKQ